MRHRHHLPLPARPTPACQPHEWRSQARGCCGARRWRRAEIGAGRRRQGSKARLDFTAGTCPGGSPGPLYPLALSLIPLARTSSSSFPRGLGVPPKVRACKLRGSGGVPRLQLERAAQQIHKRVNISLSFRPSPTGFSQCEGKEIVIWGDNTHIWGDNYNLGAER